MTDNKIEIVFSFDTTGSMYPCLTQVRRKIKSTVTRLMEEIKDIRIGIIAHGDYCDAGSTYVIKMFDLSSDSEAICNFVENVGQLGVGPRKEVTKAQARRQQGVKGVAEVRPHHLDLNMDEFGWIPAWTGASYASIASPSTALARLWINSNRALGSRPISRSTRSRTDWRS